ncbi:hypothetical protein [Enterovibrio norvegicus]|uniref:hypothetical protein n=1 Tax=Enterovibrio norvegicus TaxID=188144 RepID=UPI00031A0749|nr:hypothetical protein [Enterovibrio norvegicus]OEF57956.1 hypothetical protein A1OU_07045 [Enterovibrio norvegicus]
MSRDWKKLQAQFQHDHEKYGTGAKEWCEAKGLNYASARRHIKVRTIAQFTTAQKETAKVRSAQRRQAKKEQQSEQVIIIDESQREEVKKGHEVSGEPFRKGCFYARYFPADKQVMFDTAFTATLEDELLLTRARLQSGIEYLGKIHEDIAHASSLKERVALYEAFTRLNGQLDTLTGRVESLTRTMSTLGIDVVKREKIIAETQKLFSDGSTDDTPLGQILEELRNMGSDGLMNS